ncbi:MAG: UvrD-helicase domain-containing protein [Desulfobacterales bacterium]
MRSAECEVPSSCRGSVRFVLVAEISNIYKKDGLTRKNHNLVFMPDIQSARRLNTRLGSIGNVSSDGRPILGLDARDLLEIVLETSPNAFLAPAHIWTPWFSMLGSKSGFDSIAECFGDLSANVFAAETGLSSDPAMNWRVSSLDSICLISNSDAHSAGNVGREANLFEADLSYLSLRDALKTKDSARFRGTVEFFPEQGKYHLDGHRGCRVVLEPEETRRLDGKCPVCGKAVTVGVLSRVEELADRPAGRKPAAAPPYLSLVPLTGILAEILQAGPKTAKVGQAYRSVLDRLGPELPILMDHEPEHIATSGIPLLEEAIRRVREKRVDIRPGFDGEYGTIEIFSDRERAQLQGQRSLFAAACTPPTGVGKAHPAAPEEPPQAVGSRHDTGPARPAPDGDNHCSVAADFMAGLNADQRRAVLQADGPLMIVAGPGTGKTHTLTCRIAHMVLSGAADPGGVLALTFTHKAADEMRSRLATLLGNTHPPPLAVTFHGFCWGLLQAAAPEKPIAIADETLQTALVAEALSMVGRTIALDIRELQRRILSTKQNMRGPADLVGAPGEDPAMADFADLYRIYQHLLRSQGLYDYEDLIFHVVSRLERDADFLNACRERYQAVLVDEYQDVNHGQYRIIRALVPPGACVRNLCVIGDPDQSIYGFRGSDPSYFLNFKSDYPDAALVSLNRNYRSTDTILNASFDVISADGGGGRRRAFSGIDGVRTVSVLELPSDAAEAGAIAHAIESLVGGTGFHSIDTGRVRPSSSAPSMSYADFAVLFRTVEQIRWVAEVFEKRGIPCQAVSRRHSLEPPGVAELLSLARLIDGTGAYADLAAQARLSAPRLNRKIVEAFRRWCLTSGTGVREGLSRAARFPIPGLSRSQQIKLIGFSAALGALSEEIGAMRTVAEKISHLSRLPALAHLFSGQESRRALERLIAQTAGACESLGQFLARVALHVDTDSYHPRAEKVALMTMHAAKGLEFPVVFIAGCEEGLIPYRRRSDEQAAPGAIAEERRLLYVAMTRAKERLYLTWARNRRIHGRTEPRQVSSFLGDIAQRLIKNETHRDRAKEKGPGQLQLF